MQKLDYSSVWNFPSKPKTEISRDRRQAFDAANTQILAGMVNFPNAMYTPLTGFLSTENPENDNLKGDK